MRYACRCIGLLATLACALPAQGADVPIPAECSAPEEFTTPDEPLQHVAAAIDSGGPLNVLAIGSATTVGEASSTAQALAPGTSFPFRMVEALRAALPKVPIDITVKGGRGMTAEAMMPMLDSALKAKSYQLVLWQTGTVEAVRGMRPDGLREALQSGLERIGEANADVVLIDPQFSRFLRANTDLDPYQGVLEQIATIPNVVLFHRFALMWSWAHDGHIDLERTPKPERDKTIALLNTCLGDTLARFVLNGASLK